MCTIQYSATLLATVLVFPLDVSLEEPQAVAVAEREVRAQRVRCRVLISSTACLEMQERISESVDTLLASEAVTLPPQGPFREYLEILRDASERLQGLLTQLGECPEAEALPFVLDGALGRKLPTVLTDVQKRVVAAAEGKTGKDALRAQLTATRKELTCARECATLEREGLEKKLRNAVEKKSP